MISLIPASGFIACCTTQLVASAVSVVDECSDVSVMLAVGSFTRVASSHEASLPSRLGPYKVQHKARDMVEDTSLIQASWFRQPKALHDMSLLTIQGMLHAKMLPYYTVFASLLVVLALSCACFLRWRLMHKTLSGQDDDSMEVWEKIRTRPEGGESLLEMLKRLSEANQTRESISGYITARDLEKMMEERQVRKKLKELGIKKESFLSVFHVLEASADTRTGAVNLEEFMEAHDSDEGHLMKLLSIIDKGRGASPPGFITSDDLRFMMRRREVARHFLLLGISGQDAWGVFTDLLSSKSLWESKGLVNLADFIAGCEKLSGPRS